MRLPFLIFLILSSCVSSTTAPPSNATGFTVIYTSNRQGEIEPCGCQVNQIGGLNRLQAFLEAQPKGGRIFVDSGDTFYSAYPVNPRRMNQETMRAQLIARTYRRLGLDFFTPGERDFAGGIDRLKKLEQESGAVFLSANLFDEKGELLFPAYKVIEKGGMKILVIGIADEEAFSRVTEVTARPAEPLLKKILDRERRNVDQVLLLSHLGLKRDREVASYLGKAVIAGSHSLDVLEPAEIRAESWMGQPKTEGQQIGKIVVLPTENQAELFDLGKELDVENETQKEILAYREEVRKLSLAEANEKGSEVLRTVSFVANSFTCRACHQKQFDFWKSTKHASAYLVLYEKNQHFNPDCVGCHTLGFQDPRGFSLAARPLESKTLQAEPLMKKIFAKGKDEQRRRAFYHSELKLAQERKQIQKNFLSVQCEHCHGNRAGHPNPTVVTQKKVALSSCVQCHKPPNAREFDPKSVVKVACPLSGT